MSSGPVRHAVFVDTSAYAVELLEMYSDKGYSMIDCISFANMERLDISMAFSFDRHFVQHGFEALGALPLG